jgi:hypothetical protein
LVLLALAGIIVIALAFHEHTLPWESLLKSLVLALITSSITSFVVQSGNRRLDGWTRSEITKYRIEHSNEGATGVEYCELVLEALQNCKKICDRATTLWSSGGVPSEGSLEIRAFRACPHVTVYRADDELMWGPYLAGTRGFKSPLLKVSATAHRDLFDTLTTHFTKMWDDPGYVVLFSINRGNPPPIQKGDALRAEGPIDLEIRRIKELLEIERNR